MTGSACPYKGLVPYEEADAEFFFGRDGDREIILANLIASRLTVFYGPSGVGKSSVLRAGVMNDVRHRIGENKRDGGPPRLAIVAFRSWRDEPLGALCARIAHATGLPNGRIPKGGGRPSLKDTLSRASDEVEGDVLIILDQFEEYFLYHPVISAGEPFAEHLARTVNDPRLRANVLVALRDDAVSKLDRFKGPIANVFGNVLRLDHLDRAAAREATERPIARYNERVGDASAHVTIEPALVEAALRQVRTGKVVLGHVGRGALDIGVSPKAENERIETPFLQLVLTRIWNEEMQVGSRVLRLGTLDRLGGADRIVKTHLDRAMTSLSNRERWTAAQVFHHLVTPSGTKIAHSIADLAEYADVSRREITPVLEKLAFAETRILRPVPPPPNREGDDRYEIFHDVLAAPILDWRARYLQPRSRPFFALGSAFAASTALFLFVLGIELQHVAGGGDVGEAVHGAYLAVLTAGAAATLVSVRITRWRATYGFFVGAMVGVVGSFALAVVEDLANHLKTEGTVNWTQGVRGWLRALATGDARLWVKEHVLSVLIMAAMCAIVGLVASWVTDKLFLPWVDHARGLAIQSRGSLREEFRRVTNATFVLWLLYWTLAVAIFALDRAAFPSQTTAVFVQPAGGAIVHAWLWILLASAAVARIWSRIERMKRWTAVLRLTLGWATVPVIALTTRGRLGDYALAMTAAIIQLPVAGAVMLREAVAIGHRRDAIGDDEEPSLRSSSAPPRSGR